MTTMNGTISLAHLFQMEVGSLSCVRTLKGSFFCNCKAIGQYALFYTIDITAGACKESSFLLCCGNFLKNHGKNSNVFFFQKSKKKLLNSHYFFKFDDIYLQMIYFLWTRFTSYVYTLTYVNYISRPHIRQVMKLIGGFLVVCPGLYTFQETALCHRAGFRQHICPFQEWKGRHASKNLLKGCQGLT